MNIKLRYKLVSVGMLLAGVFLWGRCSHSRPPTVPFPATVLPPQDSEQILIDPTHKSLIVINSKGTQAVTLPDRPTVIDIHKDGSVKVTAPQYGWERRPFIGVHVSDHIRLSLGMDTYYFKRLDLGIGLASEIGPHLPIAFAQVSYNVYSNCRIGLGYGSNRFVGGTVTVRL